MPWRGPRLTSVAGQFDVCNMLAHPSIFAGHLKGAIFTRPLTLWRPAFPNRYLIVAVLGLLDFVQTAVILRLGGEECNQIALWVMSHFGLAGAAVYKFLLIGGVIALIDWLSGRDVPAARRLSSYALILGSIPAAVGLGLLTIHFVA